MSKFHLLQELVLGKPLIGRMFVSHSLTHTNTHAHAHSHQELRTNLIAVNVVVVFSSIDLCTRDSHCITHHSCGEAAP